MPHWNVLVMVKDLPGFVQVKPIICWIFVEGNQMVKFKIHEKEIELLKLHVDILLFFGIVSTTFFKIFVSV